MYDSSFINDKYIEDLLQKDLNPNYDEILAKGRALKGLSHEDVAALLKCEDTEIIDELVKIAREIKEEIYGNRIVMFAPIYISDYCINNCLYCGFRKNNEIPRKKLTKEELQEEVKVLVKNGHKRLALEAGEDPVNCDLDYVLESIKTIYDMKFNNGEIRRINVNIAATSVEEFKRLKDAEIGTYILFQETYKKSVYEKYHISGPKSNYDYHTTAFHRAMEAGIDDVGGGVLFGLHDPSYEVISLIMHNEDLEDKFNVGFHTVSLPRIRKANGTENNYKYSLDDETFLKIAAIIRVAMPYTGMIISTRESEEMRKQLFEVGITQISGGSKASVGGYNSKETTAQFTCYDERPQEEIAYWLMDQNVIPSFCTACYRKGRTGDRFMELTKSGEIKNVCLPNALLTLKEYSIDYGNTAFKTKASELIDTNIENIKSATVKATTLDYLERLEEGERDLFL